MKKLFSILLFTFFSLAGVQAKSLEPLPKAPINFFTKTVTINNVTEAQMGFWWCTTTVLSSTFMGYDMAGNEIWQIVVLTQCFWFELYD